MALRDILKDCLIFVDRDAKNGESDKITLPVIEEMTETYYNGGMAGEFEVGMAGVKAMQLEFSMTGIDRETLVKLGYVQGNDMPFTIRGALVSELVSGVKAAIVHVRGRLSKVDFGDWERGKTSTKFTVQVAYYKLSIGENGEAVVHEIDPINGLMVVNGTDQRAGIRRALGLV